MPNAVLAIGDANPDVLVRGVSDVRLDDREQRADAVELVLGGSCAIFGVAAARLGLDVALVAAVGDDDLGRFVVDRLRQAGVDTAGCPVAPGVPTGASVVIPGTAGRAILTAAGAIGRLSAADVPAEALERCDHLHLAAYWLLDGLHGELPALLRRARDGGASISLDPNDDPSGTWDDRLRDLLPLVDVYLPNAREAMRTAGAETVEEACETLAGCGPDVVVKLGEEGAIGIVDGRWVRCPSPVQEVTDTVGAGDCFDAGYVFASLAGWEPERRLAFASACGSLSTRGSGGTVAAATAEEALAAMVR